MKEIKLRYLVKAAFGVWIINNVGNWIIKPFKKVMKGA